MSANDGNIIVLHRSEIDKIHTDLAEARRQLERLEKINTKLVAKANRYWLENSNLTDGLAASQQREESTLQMMVEASNGYFKLQSDFGEAQRQLEEARDEIGHHCLWIDVFGRELTETKKQLAASQQREKDLREALSSMRGIYENQQMGTLQVAQTMLKISEAALRAMPEGKP